MHNTFLYSALSCLAEKSAGQRLRLCILCFHLLYSADNLCLSVLENIVTFQVCIDTFGQVCPKDATENLRFIVNISYWQHFSAENALKL